MAVLTGGQTGVIGRMTPGLTAPKRGGSAVIKRAWRISRPVMFQIGLAIAIALVLATLFKHDRPIGAPLFAVATLELVCAKRHRHIAWMIFGIAIGLSFTAVVSGYRSTGRVLVDIAIGVVTAFVVAFATTPRNPVKLVGATLDPLLSRVGTNVRAIASALRDNDSAAAGAALYDLVETNEDLRRLDEVLMQVRRSAIITLWATGQDLATHTTTATEIGYAVRNIRVMARHAWWGVLRGGEPVPAALPQMLDALADGVGVLRDELNRGGRLSTARPLLISAARWTDVIRQEKLGMASAAVAANADAAVLNLLIATGLPLVEADDRLHRPTPGMV
jgi:uncharacterized membrane protein YeaQ/YmgE (transglycosylase-associated protein family)